MEMATTKYISATDISIHFSSTETWANSTLLGATGTTSTFDNQTAKNISLENACLEEEPVHSSFFGVTLAVPEWEAIITAILLSFIIVLTIVGNILVILSVFTYKPLRIVQNFFIVSLAVADLTVALLVLPFNVAYSILGRWEFGIHMCKLWLTFDVTCCTSSILNLCAIALDRFWAITDPINYVHKRTVGRVLLLISGVWILSFLISSPPLFGWNDWPDEFTSTTPCELTSNRGYVIYSSLGSFFIPLIIMTIVYFEIYIATRRRLRERSLASKMQKLSLNKNEIVSNTYEVSIQKNSDSFAKCSNLICCGKNSTTTTTSNVQHDKESFSSETQGNSEGPIEAAGQNITPRKQQTRHESQDSIRRFRQSKRPVDSKHDQGPSSSQTQQVAGLERLLPTNIQIEHCEDDDDNTDFKKNDDMPKKSTICASENYMVKETSTLTVCLEKKSTGVYQFIEEKQKISLSKERRAARTLGIIMGVFVICWLPFFLMYVILPFCETCCPTQKFKNFITWLGYINSSLNPIIYTIFNLDYRRAFKRLLGLNYN